MINRVIQLFQILLKEAVVMLFILWKPTSDSYHPCLPELQYLGVLSNVFRFVCINLDLTMVQTFRCENILK